MTLLHISLAGPAMLAGLLIPTAGHCQQAAVLEADFAGEAALDEWEGTAGALVPGHDGGQALLIEASPDMREGGVNRHRPVPAEQIAGRMITLWARVKAEDISDPPNPWNGIKVMLILDLPHGRQHPQIRIPTGSFDWSEMSRTLRVPATATGATLVMGLERVSGRVWFDEVRISIGRPPSLQGARQEVMFRGHDLPRLRGAMHGPRFREEDFRALATELGANHMRWQLNWTPMKQAETWAQDLDAYDEWLEGALKECDQAVDLAEELGVVLLVDLHTPPGGRAKGGVCRMFHEQRYQDKLLEAWDRIARRYQGRKSVWAYDIINEPVEGVVAPGLLNWRELAARATDVIRAVDPGKPVVVEPGPWGSPEGFDRFIPLDRERVIYSCHMYMPHSFTHQGVHEHLPVNLVYPGVIGGEHWDKERLREALQPARDFQLEYNVAMYIGEFSAIRWAPENSAFNYLRDVIEIFEEYEWDWAYHAFREWQGWSVEHTTDPENTQRSPEPTDRLQLLTSWFAHNERPRW